MVMQRGRIEITAPLQSLLIVLLILYNHARIHLPTISSPPHSSRWQYQTIQRVYQIRHIGSERVYHRFIRWYREYDTCRYGTDIPIPINAWLVKKRMPRIQDFNQSIPPPGTRFSIPYPATTYDNDNGTGNRTRELTIPFIIRTDEHAKVAWIVEGDEAIDLDPKGSACIPGSADYDKLAEQVMSNHFGEESKWNGR
jgi:hypothetical protein